MSPIGHDTIKRNPALRVTELLAWLNTLPLEAPVYVQADEGGETGIVVTVGADQHLIRAPGVPEG